MCLGVFSHGILRCTRNQSLLPSKLILPVLGSTYLFRPVNCCMLGKDPVSPWPSWQRRTLAKMKYLKCFQHFHSWSTQTVLKFCNLGSRRVGQTILLSILWYFSLSLPIPQITKIVVLSISSFSFYVIFHRTCINDFPKQQKFTLTAQARSSTCPQSCHFSRCPKKLHSLFLPAFCGPYNHCFRIASLSPCHMASFHDEYFSSIFLTRPLVVGFRTHSHNSSLVLSKGP